MNMPMPEIGVVSAKAVCRSDQHVQRLSHKAPQMPGLINVAQRNKRENSREESL
tara:strand:+ start:1873 stop:2034 length:162 start_codon:yes stop_codon:yes gene_type:complete